MALMLCKEFLDCEGSDFPITNYSSESAESFPPCFSLYFPQNWALGGCTSICAVESPTPVCSNQNDADVCVLQQAAVCPPDFPDHLFCSTATTCSCVSVGGSEFFYTTPAATFCAETQEAADALAHAYACEHCGNPSTSIVLRGVDACACVGEAYQSQIAHTGVTPVAWVVVSGALPDGVLLNSTTGALSGTLSLSGTFEFTVRAYTASGNYAQATYRITVLEITTTSLPDYTLGDVYSAQLSATGGSGNYAWKISSGTLPTGLSLSSSGLISGTPTAVGSDTITFRVADLACESINRSFFTPRVRLTGSSVTTIATVKGFSEFYPFISTPPKKYMVRTYSTSMSGTDAAGNPVVPGEAASAYFRAFRALGPQIFDLATWYVTASGHDEINAAGQTIAHAALQLYTSCPGGTFAPVAISPTDPPYQYIIRGWCFPYWQCNIGDQPVDCAAAGLPAPSIICDTCSDPAIPTPGANLLGFSGNGTISFAPYNGRPVPSSGTHAESNREGMDDLGIFGDLTYIPSQRHLGYPTITDGSFFGEMFYKSAWAVDLSQEYTDQLAIDNATVYHSNGLAAQSLPRTTGFVSTWTTVVFTLRFSELLEGEDYVATVTFADNDGTVTTRAYAFRATGATHVITDSPPNPQNGHTVVTRNPIVAYSAP